MERKNILWLVSWYPNKLDPFDGDFIQRHAQAAAIHHNIYVVFVKAVHAIIPPENELRRTKGLTEEIIYYKKGTGALAKASSLFTWRKLHFKAIRAYLQQLGKPTIVHVHIPWKAGIIALELKKRYGLNYIITEHWGIYNKNVEDNITTKSFFVRQIWKRIFKEAHSLVSVSGYLGKEINKYLIKKPYRVIPNVVDTSLFYYSDDKYSTFTFIHVSNMVELKNVDGILEAFQNIVTSGCDQCRLIMIGNRDQIFARKAEKMGLLNKKIFFLGEVTYREVAFEMRRAHCLIINSFIETFSCVVAEALCTGVPVISTKCGALPELITHENGFLIRPGATGDLTHAMKETLEQYIRFDKKAISKNAAAKYSYPSISRAFKSIYKKV